MSENTKPNANMKLYAASISWESQTQYESIFASKKAAVAQAKKWFKETEGPREARVFDLGNELQMIKGSREVELDTLGNGRPIFKISEE